MKIYDNQKSSWVLFVSFLFRCAYVGLRLINRMQLYMVWHNIKSP